MSDDTTPPEVSPAQIQPRTALSDSTEILFRQVHPKLFDAGEPASSVFLPNPGDDNQLSTDRSAVTTAKGAYDLYVGSKRESIGTFGVTVGEFGTEGLSCFPDPVSPTSTNIANPAHALVDFTPLGTNQSRKAAKRLKKAAIARGILHRP